MNQKNLASAEAYYNALNNKDLELIERCLHPTVHFLAPLAELSGKEAVFKAARDFSTFFKKLTIRTIFGDEDQVMIVYDVECPSPIGLIRTASLVTFSEGLISRIELFYDARPFDKEKN